MTSYDFSKIVYAPSSYAEAAVERRVRVSYSHDMAVVSVFGVNGTPVPLPGHLETHLQDVVRAELGSELADSVRVLPELPFVSALAHRGVRSKLQVATAALLCLLHAMLPIIAIAPRCSGLDSQHVGQHSLHARMHAFHGKKGLCC